MAKKGSFWAIFGPLFWGQNRSRVGFWAQKWPSAIFGEFRGAFCTFGAGFLGPFWPKIAPDFCREFGGFWVKKVPKTHSGVGYHFLVLFWGFLAPFGAKRVDFWQNLPFLGFRFLASGQKVPKKGVPNSAGVRPFLGHFGFVFGLVFSRSVQKPVLKSAIFGRFWPFFGGLFGS